MPVGLLPCVIDSNVLIDLNVGKVLRVLFAMPLYLMITDLLMDELLEPDGRQLKRQGITVCPLSEESIRELLETRLKVVEKRLEELRRGGES